MSFSLIFLSEEVNIFEMKHFCRFRYVLYLVPLLCQIVTGIFLKVTHFIHSLPPLRTLPYRLPQEHGMKCSSFHLGGSER